MQKNHALEKFSTLFFASALLIFAFLGAKEIWTHEQRWADIVAGMFYRQDFLHPYLGLTRYDDKPLLSYWLIALTAKLFGVLNTFTLRLSSAISGLLAIVGIYSLGRQLKDNTFGLMSAWMLLTTFYFVFWARVASADMLNVAGVLFAIFWYFSKRNGTTVTDYAVFFMIVAVTCLCKGLVGAIIVFIAVGIDVLLQGTWRTHLNWKILIGVIPGLIVYLLPFWFSDVDKGLYLVYKENVLRYFQPFDHKGHIYTYFIYLPIYTLPWAVFLVPALVTFKNRLSVNSKWIAYTLLALFVFFSLSGSRRSYYVLPLVPFAILFIADWMCSCPKWLSRFSKIAVTSYLLIFLLIDVGPAWYYHRYGIARFAEILQTTVGPIDKWNVVLLNAQPKLNFYLGLPPQTLNLEKPTHDLLASWPILKNKPAHTIFITRKKYAEVLEPYFHGYDEVKIPNKAFWPFKQSYNREQSIAFVPNYPEIT